VRRPICSPPSVTEVEFTFSKHDSPVISQSKVDKGKSPYRKRTVIDLYAQEEEEESVPALDVQIRQSREQFQKWKRTNGLQQ